jgi:hypothetical protein
MTADTVPGERPKTSAKAQELVRAFMRACLNYEPDHTDTGAEAWDSSVALCDYIATLEADLRGDTARRAELADAFERVLNSNGQWYAERKEDVSALRAYLRASIGDSQ